MFRFSLIFALLCCCAFGVESKTDYLVKLKSKNKSFSFNIRDLANYKKVYLAPVEQNNFNFKDGVVIRGGLDRDTAVNDGLTTMMAVLLEIDRQEMKTVEDVINWFKTAKPGTHKMKVIQARYEKKGKIQYWKKTATFTFKFTEVVDPAPDKPQEATE